MLLQDTYCRSFYCYTIIYIRKAVLAAVFATLLITNAVFAQTAPPATGQIAGPVTDETGKPMEYATISLLKAADSAIIKGAITNVAGKYIFERVQAGSYIIAATNMGYKKTYSAAVTLSAGGTVSVPALTMQPESRSLNAVTITAAKPLIERKPDRMVMNVENSVLAA
ncbi:MAG: carboxypeptidase regulatory-like domain-containing protein, partial [Sphingobacteriaceae bacterium]